MEEALYESASMRAFAGVDLGSEPAPDETTSKRNDRGFGAGGQGPHAKSAGAATSTSSRASASQLSAIARTRQGGACHRRHQAHLRLYQGALSRHGEECQSAVRRLRARQSLHGATPIDAVSGGVVRSESQGTCSGADRATKKPESDADRVLRTEFVVLAHIRGYFFRPSQVAHRELFQFLEGARRAA